MPLIGNMGADFEKEDETLTPLTWIPAKAVQVPLSKSGRVECFQSTTHRDLHPVTPAQLLTKAARALNVI